MTTDIRKPDWTFSNDFAFGSRDPLRQTTPKERQAPKPPRLKGMVPLNATISVEERAEGFVAKCPLEECGYKTYVIYNKDGARETVRFHIRITHRVARRKDW